jgi:hypothetical protein
MWRLKSLFGKERGRAAGERARTTMWMYNPGSSAAVIAFLFVYDLYRSLPGLLSGTVRGKLQSSNAAPVLRVTFGWAALYILSLSYQAWSKFYAHSVLKEELRATDGKTPSFEVDKYGWVGKKHFAVNADCTASNMMEQSPIFLTALWTHATFVDVGSAAQLGWVWIVARSIYPVAFAGGLPWLLFSTGPCYICIAMLLYPVCRLAL